MSVPPPVPGGARPAVGVAPAASTAGSIGAPAKRKVCAEVCLELLSNEIIRHYSTSSPGLGSAVAIEAIGVRIGRQLVERHVRDKQRLGDTLEIIKYICKEFWPYVFKKGVDNLRTNHRGVYVLQDNAFRWLLRLAPAPGSSTDLTQQEAARKLAMKHLQLPCGILKGALCHLGVACTVEADCSMVPRCAFTVKLVGS